MPRMSNGRRSSCSSQNCRVNGVTTYILILVSALLLATGVTPLVRRAAPRLGFVDKPNARKQHTLPTPLLGGLAIYAAFIVALVILGDRFYINQVVGIFVGATLMSFMGLWDDRRGLSAWLKLGGQFLAAALLVVTGTQITFLPLPWLNVALTLLWVVFITNAMNLLDNMDGLTGGIAAIAALFFLLFAAMSRQYLVGALAAAMVGACVGFLRYNLNPASIFHG
jgi:UDP-GlcNAc:undecaprenyl-phosphate/decaprenyl-phosphate GlcNAc-1-phosphate transferase